LAIHDLWRNIGLLSRRRASQRYASYRATSKKQASTHRIRPARRIN
jgi:hypothetical protein